MIKTCSCISKFQDKRYGRNRRVHNPCKIKSGGGEGARCTVCRLEKPVGNQGVQK